MDKKISKTDFIFSVLKALKKSLFSTLKPYRIFKLFYSVFDKFLWSKNKRVLGEVVLVGFREEVLSFKHSMEKKAIGVKHKLQERHQSYIFNSTGLFDRNQLATFFELNFMSFPFTAGRRLINWPELGCHVFSDKNDVVLIISNHTVF